MHAKANNRDYHHQSLKDTHAQGNEVKVRRLVLKYTHDND